MATMSTGGMRLMHSPMAAASAANTNNNASAFAFANGVQQTHSTLRNVNAPLLLRCTPSDTTVDYDVDVTKIYEHIGDSDWKAATERCWQYPEEASTWVVRYQRDAAGNKLPSGDVLWRFLPIHSACALNPPTSFLRALLQCHPQGTRTLDDQGMLPLHYACGARCSREVLYLLLMSFPQAALRPDPNGMLPLHYLAQWGPSEPGAVDMVCVATGHKVGGCMDGDGNTAEMLAMNANYKGSEEVARKIRDFGMRFRNTAVAPAGLNAVENAFGGGASVPVPMSPMSSSSYKQKVGDLSVQTDFVPRTHHRHNSTPTDKYSSFEDDGADNNNENNLNLWNMTQQSGRLAMDKLGVSPTHDYHHANGGSGNKCPTKNYSWDHVDPTNYNSAATGIARDFSSRHSPRNNTRVGPPTASDIRRSSSTPRSFGPVAPANASATTATTTAHTATMSNSRTIYNPQHGSYASAYITMSTGLPPKSPRLSQTPKSRNLKDGIGSGVGGGYEYLPNQDHHQESREPESDNDRQDRRLSELREELSSIRTVGGSGSSSSAHVRQPNHCPPTASVRFEGDEAPRSNVINTVTGGSFANSSLRAGHSGSMHDSSNSNTSYGTQLAQQLHVFNEADKRRHDDDEMKTKGQLHDEPSNTKPVTLEEMRLRETIEAAKINERDAAIHSIQLEKEQREIALLEEIKRLRAGKEHAEAALRRAGLLKHCVSVDGSKGASKEEGDGNDDDVSKLTLYTDFDDAEGVEIISSPRTRKGRSADETTKQDNTSSRGSNHNDVELLMREKSEIELAIKQAMSMRRDKEVSAMSNAGNVSTDESESTIEETNAKIARLMEQLSIEQKKSTDLEKEVLTLKEENKKTNRSHSEAVFNHLQEVKSLRDSFEKAKVEIDKYRNDAEEILQAKEKEWNDERHDLLKLIEDHKVKCVVAQTEVEEYRKICKDNDSALNLKDSEWKEKQHIFEEQIKDLSDKLNLAQNDERNLRALMEENEGQWRGERACLETEIKLLKENRAARLESNPSTTSSSSNENGAMTHLRIQLANAVKEAEDMRKFNTAIRGEHEKTVESLESELKDERERRTESLTQIVTLQYKIATLEQELEDAKEDKKEKLALLQPTPRNRSHDSLSYYSNSQDSHSHRSIEENRSLEIEVNKLRGLLIEKMDEAQEYRQELDAMKKMAEEKELCEKLDREDKFLQDPFSAQEIDKIVQQKDEDNERRIKKIIADKDEEFERKVSDLEERITTLNDIISTKDEEFEIAVAELEDDIKRLKKELEVAADEHKTELGECKRELDRQRRKHRSEMNQLNNTLEMQKSKQERLQSHIKSLEKQISDMVNDYESRLMSEFYDNVDDV
ncbi:hypothetical protein ACHAW5_010537 [Stephanodiscus triporus]|uniref:Uncharacterized protein n=1 Tax=Stephanodiscus triporus TaxID=2934178 RepID=A0ABD3PAL3_9STRA